MNGRSTQHPQQGLPTADRRKLLHERRYDIRGYEREDGMIDVEGKIVDTKPYSYDNHDRGYIPGGEPLHEMHLYSPYRMCPGAADAYTRLEGLTIGPGFNKRAAEAVGTAFGCTHITEMLRAMGTVAFQSMWPIIHRKEKAAEEKRQTENPSGASEVEKPKKRPGLLGSCHAHAPWSEVVERNWPDFFDPEAEAVATAKLVTRGG